MSIYGICRVSIAFVRQLPGHKSPLISQVLFGEYIEIVSKKNKNWFRIKCQWDNTVGWVDPKQFYFVHEKQVDKIVPSNTFALEHLNGLHSQEYSIPISIGSNLANCDGLNVKLPFGQFQYHGQIVNLDQSRHSDKLLLNIAMRYLHCPYLHGGRSILGLDAPGFIQVIFKMIGIELPRFVSEQTLLGEDVGFHSQGKLGDIAFFESEKGMINHVGLVLDDNRVLHVFGQARIDGLDQQGIYDLKKKKYFFKLRSIKRILPSGE